MDKCCEVVFSRIILLELHKSDWAQNLIHVAVFVTVVLVVDALFVTTQVVYNLQLHRQPYVGVAAFV